MHRHLRARIKRIVDGGQTRCCFGADCYWAEEVDGKLVGGVVHPDEDWHLDHTPDRRGYRGVAHAKCNTSDGARRGNAMRGRRRSRVW